MSYYSLSYVGATFQPILKRIEQTLGRSVCIIDDNDEWVQFIVNGMNDRNAILAIERANEKILGEEAAEFQVLCPSNADEGGEGLWLHYLDGWEAQREYRAGCWFY